MEISKLKSNKIKLGLGLIFALSLGMTMAFAGGEKSTKADSSAANNAITTEGMADCEKEMPDCHKNAQCPKGKKCMGHHKAKGDSSCAKKDHDK